MSWDFILDLWPNYCYSTILTKDYLTTCPVCYSGIGGVFTLITMLTFCSSTLT